MVAQRAVTGSKQRLSLGHTEVVRGPVAAADFDENQGAVVGHKKPAEKAFRCPELFLSPTPESPAADFTPLAVEALNRSLGMHFRRPAHRRLDSQPFLDRLYLAKQHGRNRYCAADKLDQSQKADIQQVCPKLEEALVMIQHGNMHHLTPHLPEMLQKLLPLLELANQESREKIDVSQIKEVIAFLNDT